MSVVDLDARKTQSDTAEPQDTAEAEPPRKRRRHLKYVVAGCLVAGLAVAATFWLMDRWSHVYVDDARIAANIVTVSSEASGRVTAMPVVAGQTVGDEELLASIETSDAELALRETAAQIDRIDAEKAQLRAQKDLVAAQLDSRTRSARAGISAAEAEERARAAELGAAEHDFDRVSSLYETRTVSAQRFEEVQTRLLTARQQDLQARAGIETAQAALASVQSDRAQLDVLDRQIATLEAETAALEAQRERQDIDLGKRQMRAAFPGVIDQTFVDEGEYVAPGTRLLMYHDPSSVWVDANVKETDFGSVALEAPVTVTVDAYPGRKFRGRVVRLGQAATSQFALLPTPNPSGNFTKITQRIPIRVAIDQDQGLLRPGMMVELAIDVVD